MREEYPENFKGLGESGRPNDIQWWHGDTSLSVVTQGANLEMYIT